MRRTNMGLTIFVKFILRDFFALYLTKVAYFFENVYLYAQHLT